MYKYVWDAAKIIHKRKFIFLNVYLTKEKRLKDYHLGFQWKMIEKQIKPNIKLKEVNNKMLDWWNTKKAIGVAVKYKVNFAKMVNKIEIFLGRLIKGKKKKNRLYR